MRKLLIIAVILVLALVNAEQNKKLGCNSFCMARSLDGAIPLKELKKCIRSCLSESSKNMAMDDTVSTIKKLRHFVRTLQAGVQAQEALLKNQTHTNSEAMAPSSDSEINPGATLEVTSSNGINVRSGKCECDSSHLYCFQVHVLIRALLLHCPMVHV